MPTLLELIAQSHDRPNDDAFQETVLRAAFLFLSQLDRTHLFCDSNKFPVAIHALILFSFMQSEALEWYKPEILAAISSCPDCMLKFHKGRCVLLETFLLQRKIPYASVKEFNDIILSWEAERVSKLVENILVNMQDARVPLLCNVGLTLTECLYAPTMFRVNPNLKSLFSRCFINCLSSGSLVPPDRMFPGLLYFLFDGTTEEKLWALEFLKHLKSCEWDNLMNDESTIHIINIQNPQYFSDQNCIRFWLNFKPFLALLSPDCIENKFLKIPVLDHIAKTKTFPFQVVPVNVVLINQLFAFLASPLPILLSVLSILLSKLGSNFWKVMKPFTFINFLDSVLGGPHYIPFLRTPVPYIGPSAAYQFADLLNWIPNLYDSLANFPSQQQQAGLKIANFLLANGSNNAVLVFTALNILLQSSSIKSGLLDSQQALELLSKVDTRNFINMQAKLLIDIARGGNNYRPELTVVNIDQVQNKLTAKAINITCNAVLYDVYYFAGKGHNLKENKNSNLGNTTFNTAFWDELISKLKPNDIPFAIEIMKLFSKVCCIVPINEKLFRLQHNILDASNKTTTVFKQILSYNAEVALVFKYIQKLLDKLNAFDGELLKSVLVDPYSAQGYWACILSSDRATYQSAVNLLYEAFDVEGRLEGVKAVLSLNPHAVLSSLQRKLSWLMRIRCYDPCPSAVRVLMDIVSSLSNAVDGVFTEMMRSEQPVTVINDLKVFWKKCWLFLNFIYKTTLKWAQVFSLSALTDFTRDSLDLSHMLIDCYNTIKTITRDDSLFVDILNTFENMLVWLRLGDMSLLSSCVSLIFKTLDLSEEQNLPIGRDVIELLAQYGAKLRKFNNRLTEKQRIEILERAREFDEELVDKIVDAASGLREGSLSRASSTQPEVVEIVDDDEEEEQVKRQASDGIKKASQSNLSKFLSRSDSPIIAPPPKQPPQKTSMLMAAKLSLASKRSGNTPKPVAAPAPPRPAGFNRKQDSDSDSSDSDSDDEHDSLFRPVKKDKIISQKLKNKTMSGPPRSLQFNKAVQKKQMDQKEIDAYNMRMRLNVDLNPLYKHVLSWNYSRTDDFPQDLKDNQDVYKRITDSFPSHQRYIETFEPLLLLECWQSIQQSKQIGQEVPFSIVIGSRSTVNEFFEVYASVKRNIVQDRKFGESDMIVLSFNPEISGNSERGLGADVIKNSKQTCLAKIKEMKNVNAEFCDITLRVNNRNNPLTSFLTPRTELMAMKVMQMITIEREYTSLKGLPYYDLSKEIVQAIPNIPEKLDPTEKEKMRKLYDVNPSQAQAIAGSVHTEGFSLIQGPPGTGKTKTILGIVGYILTSLKNSSSQSIQVPGSKKPDQAPKMNKNVLICAPSNAAVDELVLRLRAGIKNASGEMFNPRVVRLGRSDAINPAVRDLTLEELVDKELDAKEGLSTVSADPKIRLEHTKCVQERDLIKNQLQQDDLTPDQLDELNLKLRKCVQRKNELGKQLDEQREKISKSTRSREIEKRAIQARLLTQAQVICSTLSGSAHDVLASLSLNFDTVVIDEAAQCIELSAIIPLRYGCKKCIMVGDPNQLPPTVLSQAAASYAYEQSLFVRMQTQHPDSIYLLDVQYRMHPEISRFPSKQFYDSKLIDGPDMSGQNTRVWHKDGVFKPYLFYDIVGAKQTQNQRTKSFYNSVEASIALELVGKLFHDYYDENWAGRIGIISPYKEQIRLLRDMFVKKFGNPILREIDFNTVDGFQGQEKEIIIMSCVRASEASGVGFLSDVRRMNVALTRSKTSLWILGSKSSLIQNKVWLNLINDADSRGLLLKASPGFLKSVNKLEKSNQIEPASSGSLEPKKKKPATVVTSKSEVESTKSGNLKSPIPPPSVTSIVEKPRKRVTVPFVKQKRNVLTAESLKRASKQPTSSGSLPKADVLDKRIENVELKATSSGNLPKADIADKRIENAVEFKTVDPRLKRKLSNAREAENAKKLAKLSSSSDTINKVPTVSSGTIPPPPPPPPSEEEPASKLQQTITKSPTVSNRLESQAPKQAAPEPTVVSSKPEQSITKASTVSNRPRPPPPPPPPPAQAAAATSSSSSSQAMDNPRKTSMNESLFNGSLSMSSGKLLPPTQPRVSNNIQIKYGKLVPDASVPNNLHIKYGTVPQKPNNQYPPRKQHNNKYNKYNYQPRYQPNNKPEHHKRYYSNNSVRFDSDNNQHNNNNQHINNNNNPKQYNNNAYYNNNKPHRNKKKYQTPNVPGSNTGQLPPR